MLTVLDILDLSVKLTNEGFLGSTRPVDDRQVYPTDGK